MKLRKGLLISLVAFLSMSSVYSAVVVTSNIATTASCSVSSKTIYPTVTASDDLLLTIISHHSFTSIVSVTYNGTAMDFGTSTADLATYSLKNPAVGTFPLTVTVSTAGGCIGVGASVLAGVDLDTLTVGSPISDTPTPFALPIATPVVGSFWWSGGKIDSGATLTAGSGTFVGSQPEVSAFGTYFGYSDGILSVTDPTFANYTAASGVMYSLPYIMKAGGAGPSPAYVPPSTAIIPASLYSQKIIAVPTSTTTYSFVSTIASSTLKQAGLVFIVHTATTSPNVTWGTSTMLRYDTTQSFGVSIVGKDK